MTTTTEPAQLHTQPDGVWFRTGDDVLPTRVFVVWDGGDRAAISVEARHEGLGVLITLDDLVKMHHAIEQIIQRAGA